MKVAGVDLDEDTEPSEVRSRKCDLLLNLVMHQRPTWGTEKGGNGLQDVMEISDAKHLSVNITTSFESPKQHAIVANMARGENFRLRPYLKRCVQAWTRHT